MPYGANKFHHKSMGQQPSQFKTTPLGLTLSSTRTLLIYVPNEEKYDPRPTDGWGDGFRIPSVEATLIGQTLSNSFINSISRNRLKTIQLNTSYVHYTINIWNTSKIPIANIESSYQPNSRSIMANNEKKENIYVILIIFRVDAPWLYVCVYDVPWLIHTTHHFYIIPVQCSTQQSI